MGCPAATFVTLPELPAGGLAPLGCLHGWSDIPVDLSGYAIDLPYRLVLQPGWNFIGIPAIDGIEVIDFAQLLVYDELGMAVSSGSIADLIGSVALLGW